MNYLTSFYKNKCLFKCPQDQFNDNIKTTLSSILSCNSQSDILHILDMDNYYGKRTCIICLHSAYGCGNFIICNKCCNICLNKSVTIEINTSSTLISSHICYKFRARWIPMYHTICEHFPNLASKNYEYRKDEVLTMIINSSHKLIHRYYHTNLITFLMLIYDSKSSIYVLHLDVIKYILYTYIANFFY